MFSLREQTPQGLFEFLNVLNFINEDIVFVTALCLSFNKIDQVDVGLDGIELVELLVDENDVGLFVLLFDPIHDLEEERAFAHAALADDDFDDILIDKGNRFFEGEKAIEIKFIHT